MMTFDRSTAVSMIGTVLLDHDLVSAGFNGMPGQIGGCEDGSPASRARSQAADLVDEYGMNANENVEEHVPASMVTSIISDLCDEVEERTGERPELPVAFTRFRC